MDKLERTSETDCEFRNDESQKDGGETKAEKIKANA